MRRQRRLHLDGQFFFRAKRAAAGRQRDLDVFRGKIQRRGDLGLIERRALALRKHLHALSLRDRQASLWLEKCRFDGLRCEGLLDHVRGSRQCRIHIAARKRGGVQQVRMHVQIAGRMYLRRIGQHCRERVGHRLVHFVINSDLVRGLSRVESRVGYHQRQNIADAARGLADGHEDRQVRNRETRAALSGNIGRCENPLHARHRLRRRRIDRQNLGARVRTQHRRGVQHARRVHVIHERLLAQRLLDPQISRWRLSRSHWRASHSQ